MPILLLIVGLLVLVAGAELLVRSASRLAAIAGISPLVIGLTVVAFGTSAPEMAVSVQGALTDRGDIAIGNVVGSNIFNVLFILGASALITPLVVHQQIIRIDVPVMIGVSLLTWLLCLDNVVGRSDGLALTVGIVGYTTLAIWLGRGEASSVKQEYEQSFGAPADAAKGGVVIGQLVLIAVGLVMLVLGARWLVGGAVQVARTLGVSELVIGLTIVAAGTSLPEVATSIMAAARGQRDIAVGNVVGSNIFNLLAILGVASVVSSTGIAVSPAALAFDVPVMTAVAVACLPILTTGHVIARWEGGLFLGYYIAYTAYLVLSAVQHHALPVFRWVMLALVIPLTVVTLAVCAVRAARQRLAAA